MPGELVFHEVDAFAFDGVGDDNVGAPWFEGEICKGLADGGVDYAVDDNNAALITDDMKAKIEELKAGILDGSVEVHDYYTDNACPL